MRAQNHNIEQIKNQIIDTTLIGASFIGGIAYIASLTRFLDTDFQFSSVIEFIVISGLIAITIFRNRFSLAFKTLTIIILIFLLFLNDIISYGILSAAKTAIILIPFFSLVYFSLNRTIAIYILAIGSFLLVGYFHHIQFLHIPYNPSTYVFRIYPWIINAMHISLIAFIVLIITNRFNLSYNNLITELISTNKVISEREQSYREIFNASSDAIFVHDLNGNIIDVNNSMLQMYGYQKDDIPNLRIADLSLGEKPYSEEDIKNLFQIAQRDNIYAFDWKAKKKNGKLFWVEVILKKANIIGEERFLAIVRDIDEKKETALQLEKYKFHLESLVKERTEELETSNEEIKSTNEELLSQREELETLLHELKTAQEQLIRSEKMASLGVLAAGVAHEINNPLNFIQGGVMGLENYFIEHLQKHLSEVSPLIDGINEGVKRASNIVTSLNHYSYRDDLPMTVCDIHSIIDNCLIILQNQIKNKVEIQKNYTQQNFKLFSNEGKMHQAMLNIIANAVQSIDAKGIISISTLVKNNELNISINDNGCGISKENLPKIFDPFFTTKDPGKGTGLGLSITYTIIKEHDGSIDVKSVYGKGTTFLISLPISINDTI